MVNLERKRLSAESLVRLSVSRTAYRNAAESVHSVIILGPHSPALSVKSHPLARYRSGLTNTTHIHIIISEYKVEIPRSGYDVEPLQLRIDRGNDQSNWDGRHIAFLSIRRRLHPMCPRGGFCFDGILPVCSIATLVAKPRRGKSRTRRYVRCWSRSRKE